MRNSTQLLIKIYEDEDAKYNVTYKEGVLLDIWRPLNPRKRKYGGDLSINKSGDDASLPTNDEEDADNLAIYTTKKNAEVKKQTGGLSSGLKGFSKLKEALQGIFINSY